jgi:dihydroorotase
MVGLESALSVVQAAVVDTGIIGWADVARVLSSAPAVIGQLAGYDSGIVAGATEFTLYDPRGSFLFDETRLHGKGLNSPFLGVSLPGRVMATVHHGYPTVLDGNLVEADTVAANAEARRGTGAQRG